MFICEFCKKQFQNKRSVAAHRIACKLNPKFNQISKRRVLSRSKTLNKIKRQIICPKCGVVHLEVITELNFQKGRYKKYCSRTCANSHYISQQQKQKVHNKLIQNSPIHICKVCQKEFRWCQHHSKSFCSNQCFKLYQQNKNLYNPEYCQKMSKIAKAGNYGGITKQSYQAFKRGWYNGIFCGSSWQLAFVIYMLDNGYNVKRCQKIFEYSFNNKIFKYYPDFEIDDIIYEIKGYEDSKAKIKHQLFPFIKYYDKEKMKPILKYVKEKYGKNFTSLFQNRKI